MTGLEKILSQIKSDADNTCADIKNRTDLKCDDIVSRAHQQASIIEQTGKADAAKNSEDIISRAKSTAELEQRSVILKVKQDSIASALLCARQYLCDLPDADYFELIMKMAQKYSENKDGVICFNNKDLSRIPADFEKKLQNKVKGTVKVSADPVDIDGGFILKYGGIEINCAFSSIFSAEAERFSDEVSKILF